MTEKILFVDDDPNILEAKFVVRSNMMFHRFSEDVQEETGAQDPHEIVGRWESWLKEELRPKA